MEIDNELNDEEISVARRIKRKLIKEYHPDTNDNVTGVEISVISKIFNKI